MKNIIFDQRCAECGIEEEYQDDKGRMDFELKK